MPAFHLKAVKMKRTTFIICKGSYTRRQAKKIEKIYQSFCSFIRIYARERLPRLCLTQLSHVQFRFERETVFASFHLTCTFLHEIIFGYLVC